MVYGPVHRAIDSYCASPEERREIRQRTRRGESDVFNPCMQCFDKDCSNCTFDKPELSLRFHD